MGWDGHYDRQKYVAEKMKGWSFYNGTVTVRKHHAHGNEDWLILDAVRANGMTNAIITVFVWDGGMVKWMDEACGPYYYGCPIEWLDEVPEPILQCGKWRARRRALEASCQSR